MTYHEPVLVEESLHRLLARPEGLVVDCTCGGGGHTRAILARQESVGRLLCLDRDQEALEETSRSLPEDVRTRVRFHHGTYDQVRLALQGEAASGILMDLGVSSHQLDARERGFSFAGEHPVDMRMDASQGPSAEQWLREVDEEELAQVLRRNSDLQRARRLAGRIRASLQEADEAQEPYTSAHLRRAVERAYPDLRFQWPSLHARVFQAIRMEVNQEMPILQRALREAVEALEPGGRLVVISYHSVEDRMVKHTLAELERQCLCPEKAPICTCGGNHRRVLRLDRHPVLPQEDEVRRNSRARSAKLRSWEKVAA